MEPKLCRMFLLASDIIYSFGADCVGLGWVYLSKAGSSCCYCCWFDIFFSFVV